eukprot:CAMPEP_0114587410 /NCGR_PEP_ID=MMETSP0125-20121206/10372_1 /TAXON_ID=485358 ORGANISM="Aristerostoma sp., Strain ATCC 50986" /NCGR_SAMPLE_ID=MMETSP0125 /ASSEMBLY_ACC=CAM_ASM_000245 /LENGTH=62 /DNA_ID=CAMNT_0001783297 /DNA_START=20 /DNA_END=208 /DNA_ORIENTATION=+
MNQDQDDIEILPNDIALFIHKEMEFLDNVNNEFRKLLKKAGDYKRDLYGLVRSMKKLKMKPD